MAKHLTLLCTALLLALTAAPAFAQSGEKSAAAGIPVRGSVVDSLTGEPVAYATLQVTPHDDPKKTLKVGTSDERGKFELRMDKAGRYALAVYYVGKKTATVLFDVADGDRQVALAAIAMEDSGVLDEVVVQAVKPLVAVDLDKISYSTEDDPDAQTNNVLDMLRKVPMVTIDAEDNIELKGSTSFKIHIDGKPSNLMVNNPSDVLKSMPANTIKRIEVITDPGAKYDAEGVTGIINIVTNRQPMGGYTVSLNAATSAIENTLGGYNGGLYASLKAGKLGFTGNFSYNRFTQPNCRESSFRESYTDNTHKYFDQNQRYTWDGKSFFGYGELTYELDTLNLFSVSFNSWGGGGSAGVEGFAEMQNAQHSTVYSFRQTGSYAQRYGETGVNANYQRSFRKKDELLTASYRLNLSPNGSDVETEIEELLSYPSSRQKTKNDAEDTEHTFQLDYTTPIAKVHTVEGGAKYILRLNESTSGNELYDTTANAWHSLLSANDRFKYRYDIAAAYLGYNLRLKALGFKAGLRTENTKIAAEYPLHAAQDFSTRYLTWVPSTTVTYKLKQIHTLRLGYNLRMQRPGIWHLNPYLNTSDPKNLRQGNPNLDAEKAHNLSLSYSMFKAKFNVNANLSYNHTGNTIQQLTTLLSKTSDTTYTTYQNVGVNNRVSLDVYGNYNPNTKLRLYVNASLNHSDFRSNNELHLRNAGFGQRLSGNVQYSFPLDFRLSFNGGWSAPRINIQGQSSGYHYYNLSLSKSFLDKKLTCSVSSSNFFDEHRRWTSERETDTFRSVSENLYPARSFRFTLSYRVGEMKQQLKKVQRGINNDDTKAGEGGSSGSGEGGGQ